MQIARNAIHLCLALAAWVALPLQPARAEVLTDEYLVVREGNANNAAIGYSIATAGDVNGDGLDDIIIGGKPINGNTHQNMQRTVAWNTVIRADTV